MFASSIRLGWCRGIATLTMLTATSIAQAQGTPGGTQRVDPLDAQAGVPAVTYSSSLAGYRPLGDDKRIPWKAANETVNRVGGWRAYTREAQQPEPATPVHGGHRTH